MASLCFACVRYLLIFGQQSNWKTNKKYLAMYSHKKIVCTQVARNEIEFIVDLFHWMKFEFALGTLQLRKLLEKLPAYCFKVIIISGELLSLLNRSVVLWTNLVLVKLSKWDFKRLLFRFRIIQKTWKCRSRFWPKVKSLIY